MTGKTHLIGGVLAGAAIAMATNNTDVYHLVTMSIAGGLGGLLPDIDKSNSKIGSKVKPASWLIENIFGHRKIFHFWLFYLLLAMAVKFLAPNFDVIWNALFAGVGSHLFLDALNHTGIPLLVYPTLGKLKTVNIHLANIQLKSLTESFIYTALVVSCICIFANEIMNINILGIALENFQKIF